MSKEPKACTSCEGKGIHTWMERNGTARGMKCQDCKGSGKELPILKPATEPHD